MAPVQQAGSAFAPYPNRKSRLDHMVERVIAVAALGGLVLGLLGFLGVRVEGPGSQGARLERLESNQRVIKQVVCILARRTDPTIVPPECAESERLTTARFP